jgi:putative phage-type endonuclease
MSDREKWLAWRRTGITATDTAGILGLSPYSSPWAVWADKAGLLAPADVTDAMEFGSRSETMLAQWFTDKTGLYVAGEQTWCTTSAELFMLATVDGFVVEAPFANIGDAIGGFEIKTTTDTAKEWDEKIPDHIVAQVQWQMAVTGMPATWLATLHLGFRVEFATRVIERNEGDIGLLVNRCRKFWTDHCLTGVPPDADGSDATTNALRDAYPGDSDLDAVEATPALLRAQDRILANEERIKTCQAIIDAEKNLIRAALGDHTALTTGVDAKGKPVVVATWKPSSRSGFDTTRALAEVAGLDVYRTTTATRTLLVKPPKKAA